MANSVVFVAVLLLAVSRGAPLDESLMSSRVVMNAVFDDVEHLASTKDDCDERQAALQTKKVLLGESLGTNVTISDEVANKLRDAMENATEQLFVEVSAKLFRCGKVAVCKVDLGPSDIPSYFYDVRCPKCSSGKTKGNRVFRSFSMNTVYFKKVDNVTEGLYELRLRRQIVGCCLLENEVKADLVTHTEKPATSWLDEQERLEPQPLVHNH